MAGNTNKGIRHPSTGDLMTEEQLDSFNIEKFKEALKAGTLGNTGPLTSTGWGFGPNRWEKYLKERVDIAEELNWEPEDTVDTYIEKTSMPDIDSEQDTSSEPLEEVGVPEKLDSEGALDRQMPDSINFNEGNEELDFEGDVQAFIKYPDGSSVSSRNKDNDFETGDQQRARLKKEIEERNRLLDEKAKARVEKRRAEKKDKDLDKEFSDFESELEDERLDEELNAFEEDVDKEKQLGEDLKADVLDEITGETIDKHIEGNKADKGMLTKEEEAPLDEQDMNIYIGEIEKAGLKGPEAQALAIKMMSMCGNR